MGMAESFIITKKSIQGTEKMTIRTGLEFLKEKLFIKANGRME